MKKRVLCAAIASMMVLSMAACSSGSTAATTAETKASEAETTTVAASSEKAGTGTGSCKAPWSGISGTANCMGCKGYGTGIRKH